MKDKHTPLLIIKELPKSPRVGLYNVLPRKWIPFTLGFLFGFTPSPFSYCLVELGVVVSTSVSLIMILHITST